MAVPVKPKIYHIVHVDRLTSIISDGCLWCDAEFLRRSPPGTTVGINHIKQRRLQLSLTSHPRLHVGDCVPFYFCPRSIMLYLIYQGNHPDLAYTSGQGPIIHLEADLHQSVAWAQQHQRAWAFTLSNAGAYYFEDRCDLARLDEIDWQAVQSNQWSGRGVPPSVKEGKQAEFLMELSFPWELIERIGVCSKATYHTAANALGKSRHRPPIEIKPDWYY
ncbi:MAG: DUF4433 domain-containing protein [Desulfatitalea sp.]|nr:DUF4433 domain-containing protein [Desulfatitalea sp.]NNK00844.1 DUF4433 domain-containing protein [Desulfatitalea sp.]